MLDAWPDWKGKDPSDTRIAIDLTERNKKKGQAFVTINSRTRTKPQTRQRNHAGGRVPKRPSVPAHYGALRRIVPDWPSRIIAITPIDPERNDSPEGPWSPSQNSFGRDARAFGPIFPLRNLDVTTATLSGSLDAIEELRRAYLSRNDESLTQSDPKRSRNAIRLRSAPANRSSS